MKEQRAESDEERNTGHMNEERFYHNVRRTATQQHLEHGLRLIFRNFLATGLKVTLHLLECDAT
jgi:hypothetical protein